jgi:hypothetical protein
MYSGEVVLCTQVNMMFVMCYSETECISTPGKLEKYATVGIQSNITNIIFT